MAAKKSKKTVKRRPNKPGRISEADIAKFPPAVQAQIRAQMGAIERAEEKAATLKQKKAVELRKRGLLSRLRTRLNVLRKSKKFTVTARDTARCPKKKIKVRALTEDNAVSLAKRRLGSRYDQVRVQNPGLDWLAGPTRSVQVAPGVTVSTRAWTEGGSRRKAKRIAKKINSNPRYLVTATKRQSVDLGILEDRSASAALRRAKQIYGKGYTGMKAKRNGVIEKAGTFATSVAKRTIKASGKMLTGVGKVLSNPTLPKLPTGDVRKLDLKQSIAQRRQLEKIEDSPRLDKVLKALTAKFHAAGDQVREAESGGNAQQLKAAQAAFRTARGRSERAFAFQRAVRERIAQLDKHIAFLRSQAKKNPCGGGRRRNESGAAARREEFAGKVTGYKDLFFPEGTPQGLSTLGPLRLIRTAAGDIQPVNGGAWLCQDAKGRLFIGASSERPLWNGAAQSFGAVKRVEYECAKPHLGEPGKVIWFHDFEAPLPELQADGKGGLRFVGGGYTIQREGIVG